MNNILKLTGNPFVDVGTLVLKNRIGKDDLQEINKKELKKEIDNLESDHCGIEIYASTRPLPRTGDFELNPTPIFGVLETFFFISFYENLARIKFGRH